ncbi:unnamed protein product, partial [Allacma fusca]
MGCSVRSGIHRRKMVDDGFETLESHKLPRIIGSFLRTAMLRKYKNKLLCSSADGQQVSSCLHQQAGRYQIGSSQLLGSRNMGMVPNQTHLVNGRIPARTSEPMCRLRIPPPRGLKRLAVTSRNSSSLVQVSRSLRDRPLCKPQQSAAQSLLELEDGPMCRRDRQFFGHLDKLEGIRFPTILSSRELHTEVSPGSSNHPADCSLMAKSTLVPNVTSEQCSQADSAPTSSISVDRPSSTATPPDNAGPSNSGSMGNIRGPSYSPEVSTRATELISAAIRPGTQRSYSSAWKTFQLWCLSKGLDP